MYILQLHVDEYVAYVLSDGIVTRNDIRGDRHTVTIETIRPVVQCLGLIEEGPDTPVRTDWEMWD
jgi:hypothetical protein